MSGSGLPLGLSAERDSNSPERKASTKQEPTERRPSSKQEPPAKVRRTSSMSRADAGNEQDSDSGPAGRIKPVLTEEQKKANHIQSEQKRREKIREQYDKLAELTPGMSGQGRSEGRVLEEAVKYAQGLKDERAKLIQEIEARGGVVPEDLKKY